MSNDSKKGKQKVTISEEKTREREKDRHPERSEGSRLMTMKRERTGVKMTGVVIKKQVNDWRY